MGVKRINGQELLEHDLREKIIELLRREPLSVPKIVEKIFGREKSKGNRHKLKARLSYHVMKLKDAGFIVFSHEIETPTSKKRSNSESQSKMFEVYYRAIK